MAFSSVQRERCFGAFVALLLCLLFINFRPGSFDASYDLFNVQKIANQNRFDIVVCGNSRSHENIDYSIIQSYLPNVRIFNFAFGGNSCLSKEIMEAAAKRLNPNGKRIFLWMIEPFCMIQKINDFYHQYSSEVPFYQLVGEKNWSYFRLFLKKVSFFNKILFNTHPTQIFEEGCWYTYQTNQISECTERYQDKSGCFIFQKINFSMLEKSLQFMKENHIRCIVVHAPSFDQYTEIEEDYFHKNHVKEFFQKHGVDWIDREALHLHSYDNLHVNVESGQRFAHWLGKKLSKIDWFQEK